MSGREGFCASLLVDAGGDHECADPVLHSAILGRDEIGQAPVRLAGRLGHLLAQVVPGHEDAALLAVDLDVVVVHRVGGEQADHRAGFDPVLRDHLLQHGPGIMKQLARFLAHHGIIQNFRVAAVQFPGLEEGRPVDDFGEFGKGVMVEHLGAEHLGGGRGGARPIRPELVRPRFCQRYPLALTALRQMAFAYLDVIGLDLGHISGAQVFR